MHRHFDELRFPKFLRCPREQFLSLLVKPGENRIEVLVYNTLGNHYVTIPTLFRGPLTSGLIGPVTLEFSPQEEQ